MSSPQGPEMQSNNVQHLDEMTILLYVERQLDRARAAEVSAHTQECDTCCTLMRALERESRLLTRAMLEEEEPLPARLAHFQEAARRSMQWIWMVLFGLAATGVYAIYTSYVEPVQNRLHDAGFGGTNLLGLLVFQGAFWKGWQSMASFVEIVAFLVLGVSAALLFRRWFRRGTVAALLMAGMCGALMVPSNAAAFESRKGESIEVAKDETIKGDILLTGHQILINGTVEGDVYAFGQNIEVNGHIKGDLLTGAQTVHVSGQIDGNIRAFLNTLTIPGVVGRNVMAWAQVVNVDSAGKVGRSVTSFCQTLGVDGKVGGDLVALDQSTRVSGTIDGGVKLKGETLMLKSSAQVAGPVSFEGEKEPFVESGAKLASGPVSFTKHRADSRMESKSGYYIWRLLWSSSFILLGLVLIWLMPSFAGECVTAAENAGASIGLGVLVGISAPIAAFFACVTIVGLPLGIMGCMLWLVLLFTAQIVVGGLIGRWILGRSEDTWGRVGRMALGMAIIGVIVPILHQLEFIETLFRMVAMIWGFGAISLALYRRVTRTQGEYAAPPMVA